MIALWLLLVFCFHSTTAQWPSAEQISLLGPSLVYIDGRTIPVTCDRLGMQPCLLLCDVVFDEKVKNITSKVRKCRSVAQKNGDDCMVTPSKKYGPKCKNKGCEGWNGTAVVLTDTSPWPQNYTECVLACDNALHHYCYETCGNQTQQMAERQLTIDDVHSDQKCIMDTLKTLSVCLKEAVRVQKGINI